ncbi:hypothetical protein SGLAM104S_01220 [Streptomyces glaucescens]
MTKVSPDACFFTVTVIRSFLPGPLFHRSTTLSMPGVQVQYVSETGPDPASPSPSSEPHAARAVPPSVRATAVAAPLKPPQRSCSAWISPLTWGPRPVARTCHASVSVHSQRNIPDTCQWLLLCGYVGLAPPPLCVHVPK